jgi:uncharacterized membrane protein
MAGSPLDSLDQDSLMMIPRFMFAALCALGSLTCVAHGGNINGEATYISFSVPGAFGTYPTGINASMEVTGYYYVTPTVARGFLREADGTITTFNVAGGVWTQPEGINAAGNITGFYQPGLQDGHGVPVQGFLRYADGHIIIIEAPQAYYAVGAQPVSISDFDEIAGTYIAAGPGVFTRSGAGVLTNIQAPGGGSTVATAINASGSVVGYSGYTGFVAHPDGYWAEIAIPVLPNCSQQTIPDGINAAGMVAGWFSNDTFIDDPNCSGVKTGGFVMSPDGELTLFQPPGTIPTLPSHIQEYGGSAFPHWISIDRAGDVTGSYSDAAGVQHGFVRNPYGTITSFDPPEGKQTNATSISDGGAIAGFYQYNAGGGPPVGFIRVPQ